MEADQPKTETPVEQAKEQPKEEPKQQARNWIDIKIPGKDIKIDTLQHALLKPLTQLPKQRYRDVRSCTLTGNSYGRPIFQLLGQILSHATNFQKLQISDCFIGRFRQDISECLSHLSKPSYAHHTTYINVSNNAVGMHGAKAFSSVLEEARNLRYFYSTNCGLGTLGIREYVDRIGNCRNLEVLSFGKNRLETAGGLILSEAFKHLPNLKAFYCFQNGMDKSATEAIFRELHQHCPNLETLDISDNFVSEQATQKLLALMQRPSSKLKNLNLSDTIDGQQFQKVLTGLTHHKPYKWQKLGFNYIQIDQDLAEPLLQLLKQCPLTYLEMMGTELKKKHRKSFNEILFPKLKRQILFEDPEDPDMELIVAFGDLKLAK